MDNSQIIYRYLSEFQDGLSQALMASWYYLRPNWLGHGNPLFWDLSLQIGLNVISVSIAHNISLSWEVMSYHTFLLSNCTSKWMNDHSVQEAYDWAIMIWKLGQKHVEVLKDNTTQPSPGVHHLNNNISRVGKNTNVLITSVSNGAILE
jgi:hypothetical protein